MRRWWIVFGLLTGCRPAVGVTPAVPCRCECECPTSRGDVAGQEVAELVDAAVRSAAKRDGAGCLGHLDRAASLSPASARRFDTMRAQCLMLDGRCDEGRGLVKTAIAETSSIPLAPEQLEQIAEGYAVNFCQGNQDDRLVVLQALQVLQTGAYMAKKSVEECRRNERLVLERRGRVRPRDLDDTQIANLESMLFATAPGCYARAGDCDEAYAAYRRLMPREMAAAFAKVGPEARNDAIRQGFEGLVDRCR